MSALFVVLPLAVFVSALAVGAFLWAARRGQLDDLDTPALRMLHDDDALPASRAAVAVTGPTATKRATRSASSLRRA
jgi:cbb3-type cytochrome oxidase maturation protein